MCNEINEFEEIQNGGSKMADQRLLRVCGYKSNHSENIKYLFSQ